MELVGIILWPVIGLVYIVYKLIREEPESARSFFSGSTLAILAIMCAPALLGFFINKYCEGAVGTVLLGILILVLIAIVVAMVLTIIADRNESVKIFLRKTFDPAWREVYKLPYPDSDEIERITHDRLARSMGEQKTNEFMEWLACDKEPNCSMRRMHINASIQEWERAQHDKFKESRRQSKRFRRK